MGSSFSTLLSPCLTARTRTEPNQTETVLFNPNEPLDETLGHSFCYLRSSARFLSPDTSDRFVSPSHSLRFDEPIPRPRTGSETGFRAISGASVSANSYTPTTVLLVDGIYDSATDSVVYSNNGSVSNNCSVIGAKGSVNSSVVVGVNGFESTPSFSALPLQPVPRGSEEGVGGFFLSGPMERGAVSGPVEGHSSRLGEDVPFSAPLGGGYVKKKRKKRGPFGIGKAFRLDLMEKKRPLVVPVRSNFGGKKEGFEKGQAMAVDGKHGEEEENVEWALGKAGEDRVHVVVSEEQGWLFVGIYDGFNGPDAPEFLMSNLYRAVYHELQGLFWENAVEGEESVDPNTASMQAGVEVEDAAIVEESREEKKQGHNAVAADESEFGEITDSQKEENLDQSAVKKVTFQSDETEIKRQRRKLWEFLAEADVDEGLDLSGTERFAFSVDDAISVSNARSSASTRWLLLSKLRQGLLKQKDVHGKKLFPWKSGFGLEEDREEKFDHVNRVEEGKSGKPVRRRIVGPVDHDLILRAMSRALEATELAYLDMTEKVLDTNPELALMGSCLLVVLMRDEDVYVMNLGDSRAIVAHFKPEEVSSISMGEISSNSNDNTSHTEGIVEESVDGERVKNATKTHVESTNLVALQLSTDHSTSIEDEVKRIQNEHPDDNNCIVNDRVKGRLKVTRAFGAGFLKQPKLNDALLEMFRNEYIGSAPYLSCCPSLCHHRLSPLDQFLVLSSDGLYQYLTNEEVVTHVQSFLEKYPDGDPAQHLIEELLIRAAKKAGMEFHELLDIPQGDRRKYHDDVTVMVVSLEGRIWKSSGKYL